MNIIVGILAVGVIALWLRVRSVEARDAVLLAAWRREVERLRWEFGYWSQELRGLEQDLKLTSVFDRIPLRMLRTAQLADSKTQPASYPDFPEPVHSFSSQASTLEADEPSNGQKG